ncbi:MAG TPA: 16S rRNA (cytidine(1402)-2'-O)-methyltransferase [Acidimicrobiia bacterium]|nr:16S rRNA (cytidine(1402)-2'-O)-methyltransferase [Acidimicrobiia bacterium]
MPGQLILCATPIGNLGDAPPRLANTLAEADVIFAEDTRRSGVLLKHLGVKGRLRSYHAGNESSQAKVLESLLTAGGTVALMTDAGTPAISDPGMSAVAAARRAGSVVTLVAGPSAVTAALAVSGLPSERFVFEGFLPRKGRSRRQRLDDLVSDPRTVVFFVAPHHLLEDVNDLHKSLGDRKVCVARELTKSFEEVWWGTLSEAAIEWTVREPQGEFTLVVAGGTQPPIDLASAVNDARMAIEQGTPMAQAVREVVAATGIGRRRLYEAIIKGREIT